jgi:hypothetical protein
MPADGMIATTENGLRHVPVGSSTIRYLNLAPVRKGYDMPNSDDLGDAASRQLSGVHRP